jgi:hypothetical protein
MTTENRTEILTPVGRLVMGDCSKPQTKDADGNPLLYKSGASIGQPRVNYYVGVAVPKTDPTYGVMYNKIYNEAKISHPNLFDASGNCINPKFAFKIIDGDSQIPNEKGKKPCDREGFPGHWILNFSNGFAPKCYINENGAYAEIPDPSAIIKRGYYVQVYGTVKGNGNTSKPGVYLNHSMILFCGHGEEIISGPDVNAVFGTTPSALPQGASATPLAPQIPLATPGSIAPAPDFLVPPTPAPAPAVPVTYLVNGVTYSVEQLKAAKWTDEQIAALKP